MLVLVVAGFFPALAATAQTFVPNQGKLPEAAKMIESMQAANVDAKALVIESAHWLHKVVVFVYPDDSKRVWMWDPDTKSIEVKADATDPLSIGKAWMRAIAPGEQLHNAFFDKK